MQTLRVRFGSKKFRRARNKTADWRAAMSGDNPLPDHAAAFN
jgi:hypothetical protein